MQETALIAAGVEMPLDNAQPLHNTLAEGRQSIVSLKTGIADCMCSTICTIFRRCAAHLHRINIPVVEQPSLDMTFAEAAAGAALTMSATVPKVASEQHIVCCLQMQPCQAATSHPLHLLPSSKAGCCI